MPTFLADPQLRLHNRLLLLEAAFKRHESTPIVKKTVDRFALQEGLISNLWQSWGRFCRDVLVNSAIGTQSLSGANVASPYAGRPEAEIAYIARQLAQKSPVGLIKAIAGPHQEPTWGDLGKINLIATGLGTSNQATLLSAFGGAQFVSDLQLCRNASAHYCAERVADVRTARVRYNSTRFQHPSDMLRWIDPASNDPLWLNWIGEMRTVSANAIV
ncbi:MAG: hypothetical protein ACJ8FS_00715 [Sphingomicrobium sp.]